MEKTAPTGNVAECPGQSPQLSGQQLVLGEGFHRFVVRHPLDVGQATQRVVVIQAHVGAAGGAEVGQFAVGRCRLTAVKLK